MLSLNSRMKMPPSSGCTYSQMNLPIRECGLRPVMALHEGETYRMRPSGVRMCKKSLSSSMMRRDQLRRFVNSMCCCSAARSCRNPSAVAPPQRPSDSHRAGAATSNSSGSRYYDAATSTWHPASPSSAAPVARTKHQPPSPCPGPWAGTFPYPGHSSNSQCRLACPSRQHPTRRKAPQTPLHRLPLLLHHHRHHRDRRRCRRRHRHHERCQQGQPWSK